MNVKEEIECNFIIGKVVAHLIRHTIDDFCVRYWYGGIE